MLFPESPRLVFKRNPLIEVICQLRFPTILEIASEEPAVFQNRIRESYPLYERDEGRIKLDLPPDIAQQIRDVMAALGNIKRPEHMTHKFLSADSSRLISLNREFLAFTETQYDRWENFEEHFLNVESVMAEIYNPAFYTRVGVRYRDVIDRDPLELQDTPWDTLINGTLIGLLGKTEFRDEVEQLQSTVRLTLPDVDDGRVTIRHGLANREGRQVYMIDADFFTERRYAHDNVTGILRQFNNVAGNLFRWAITDRLRGALEPAPVE